ncbi:MAG: glycosyltransferase family 4 protein [Actinomycetota bacterium]|nr:glycosyltransferase family 4 protein [Chloroflexota bacterium]
MGEARRPKIALVAHWDWVLYNLTLPIARALRRAQCEVVFVSPAGSHTQKLVSEGFEHLAWEVSRKGVNPIGELSAIARLTRLYRRASFDGVQHFTIKPNLYGSIAAERAGIDAAVNTFTGLGFVFADGLLARAIRLGARPVLRWASARPGTWTVVENRADLDRLVDAGLVPRARARVIPGAGVDVARFHPRAPSPDPRTDARVRWLIAGRLLFDKGLAELAEAGARLRAKGLSIEIVVAGAPDPGNPSSVPAPRLRAWERAGAITLLGDRSDMPELLRSVDGAVLPSYHEGLPRFLLEAAASGLPLIATDIPGCRTIVRAGANGLLVPVGDASALEEAIEQLSGDPVRRARFAAASRSIAEHEFAESLLTERYLEFYRSLGLVASGS